MHNDAHNNRFAVPGSPPDNATDNGLSPEEKIVAALNVGYANILDTIDRLTSDLWSSLTPGLVSSDKPDIKPNVPGWGIHYTMKILRLSTDSPLLTAGNRETIRQAQVEVIERLRTDSLGLVGMAFLFANSLDEAAKVNAGNAEGQSL